MGQLKKIWIIHFLHIETQAPERVTDRPSVVDRIGKLGSVLVSADTDDEGYAPLCRWHRLRDARDRDSYDKQQDQEEPLHLAGNSHLAQFRPVRP